jgi:hypothetical protein
MVLILVAVFIDLIATNAKVVLASDYKSDLVQSSRSAIIETGFSARYFDEHFKLVEVFDKPGNLRVVWRFSLNGYESLVNDAIGYYTGQQQKKIYVHSIKNILGSTRDIPTTIQLRKARQLLKSCLGNYAGEAVVFMRASQDESASLFLTGHSPSKSSESRTAREQKRDADKRPSQSDAKTDQPPHEEDWDRRPLYFGYVNLETGKCLKRQGIIAP